MKRGGYTATFLAIVATVALLVATAAAAHPQLCGPRSVLAGKLVSRYSETMAGIGLASNGAVFELWRSGQRDSWTVLFTTPDGISCVVATGTDWVDAVKKPKGEGT